MFKSHLGTAGIGRATILHLAPHNPTLIIFTGRNAAAAEQVMADVKAVANTVRTIFVPCDLASLSSVREAGAHILELVTKLDIVILNAGVYGQVPRMTTDGYEMDFGTNHLGHFSLVRALMPIIVRNHQSEPAGGDRRSSGNLSSTRLVVLSSESSRFHPKNGIEFSTLTTPYKEAFGLTRYGQSKLANILFTKEFVRRYPQAESGVTAVVIHPGVVETNMITANNWFARTVTRVVSGGLESVEKGAWNSCWAATAKEEKGVLENGQMYRPVGKKMEIKMGHDVELAKKLWEWSENAVCRKTENTAW